MNALDAIAPPRSVHPNPGVSDASEADERKRLDEAWKRFNDFLCLRGRRVTQTRRIVVEHVMKRVDHFRADEAAADMATGRKRVSRATVYKTLSLMVAAGLVRIIRDGDVHTHYEAIREDREHAHMICDRCGRFLEFSPDSLGPTIRQSCRDAAFRPRTHSLVVFGLCADCSKGTNQERTSSWTRF